MESHLKFTDRKRPQMLGGSVALAVSLVASVAIAQPKDLGPYGKGNAQEGELHVELYRGAAVPFELMVIATPNDCRSHLELDIKWSEKANKVKVHLHGKDALERYPDVDRTQGVDFFPNPFFPEPEDIVDGRYQLWLVSASGPLLTFYYSGSNLDLLGSELDFESPPPGSIPVEFPSLYLFSTPLFQPNHKGDVNLKWEFAYDGATRGDRPEFAHHIVTFPPPNLCLADPHRLDLSTLRPYISAPFPADEARPWSDYLRGGLLFDVTVEPAEYYMEPPLTTLAATYSGGTAVGGAIPNGWSLDIDAAFMNVAPPIKRWSGAGTCQNVHEGIHTQDLNFCPAP